MYWQLDQQRSGGWQRSASGMSDNRSVVLPGASPVAQQSMSANKIAKTVALVSVSTPRPQAGTQSLRESTTSRRDYRCQARKAKPPRPSQAPSGRCAMEMFHVLLHDSASSLSAYDSCRQCEQRAKLTCSQAGGGFTTAYGLVKRGHCEYDCMSRV
jgi:hypothetical protein